MPDNEGTSLAIANAVRKRIALKQQGKVPSPQREAEPDPDLEDPLSELDDQPDLNAPEEVEEDPKARRKKMIKSIMDGLRRHHFASE